MKNILLSGNIKYMLVILLLLTMIPALAQGVELRTGVTNFSEESVQSDIPIGYIDPETGEFVNELTDIPRGGIDYKIGVRIPDPPVMKTTGIGKSDTTTGVSDIKVISTTSKTAGEEISDTAKVNATPSKPAVEEVTIIEHIDNPGVVPMTQPPVGKTTQQSQSVQSNGSTEIHCQIKLLSFNGDEARLVDLSENREFKTNQKIRVYCRSNIDGYLEVFQQQNNRPLELLFPYKYNGKLSDNRVYTDQLILIHNPEKWLEFVGDPGKIRLHVIFFTNDVYNIHKQLPLNDKREQQHIADVQAINYNEEITRKLVISNVPSKPVSSIIPDGLLSINAPVPAFITEVKSIYASSGFYSAINALVPVFTTEIILDQLP